DVLPLWDVAGNFRAKADLDIDAEGRLAGSLLAATDSMILRNTVRGQGWTLVVDPARLSAEVGPDGLTGELDLAVHLPDEGNLLSASGQVRLPRFTALDVDPAEQPVEGSLEFRVGDLGLVEAFLFEIADARGSFLLTTQVGGTLADLNVDGEASLSDGYALIPTLGLELTDIQFAASGRPDGAVEVSGQVRSGEGLLTLTGRSERYPSTAEPSVFQLRGERFLLLDIPEVNLLAEPSLDLAFDGSTVRLTGDVVIPRGRLGFPDIPASAVTPSDDVRFVGDSLVVREPPVPFGADITVILGDDVFFNGFGFASNLIGNVQIRQEPSGEPTGRGEVRFINGTFRSFGQELRIEPGHLLFAGPIDNPAVDARAFVRASDGTEAGFRIGGTVQELDVSTYSVPPRSDSDVMAYILFGRPMNQTSSSEGNQASNSAAILGANMLGMALAPSLGLDEARIDTGSSSSENKAQFVVGKYLSPRLFVGYGVGIYEPISTLRIRYLLSARWSIEVITGDQQSTDLLWRIERWGRKPQPTAEEEGSSDAASELGAR
ncbi:MAG: translocation/assembly module TamB domain-containing protein, partial [Gemmatimonadetes bacterium]|nr:translocation/assembly module TamB domain-containing protein [Gemmatimonadota bacterium]